MFRKLIVVAALGLGALGAVSTPVAADDKPTGSVSLHSTYEVWYRVDHHHRWRLYGTYHSHHAAHHAAHHLQHHGYEVRIDQH